MATSKNVLLVSDASDLHQDDLSEQCKTKGLKLVLAKDVSSGRNQIVTNGLPHVFIIDLNLPDQGGWDLCRDFGMVAGVPMIAISNAHEDTISALEVLACADDYVRRSEYSAEELTARIVRILSRVHSFEYGAHRQIQIARSLKIDLVAREVITGKEQHSLTPTENSLLSVLLIHRGHMVDGRTLVDRVWPFNEGDFSFNALRVHMHRLRNKIEENPERPQFITTDRGIGYRFQS